MTFHAVTRQPASRRRAGFTLIELMIVISIIVILIAILIPAVNAVANSARIAAAKTDMASIEAGIATFETEFGQQPPSYISFVMTGTPPSLPAATKATLRKMFPQINFAGITTSLTQAGLAGKELKSSEALVFFLGGVRKRVDTDGDGTKETITNELVGFSKNPSNPFAQPGAATSTRLGPFTEFDIARLVDIGGSAGVLEYVDKLPGQTMPFIYVSTARTGTYIAGDGGVPAWTPPGGGTAIPWEPYQTSASSYYNPSTYQLISPGWDGDYGHGGWLDDPAFTSNTQDNDNITNFADGELGG